MDIHEYQAKEVLAGFGVAVPDGALAYSPEQAAYRARELGGDRWVVQIRPANIAPSNADLNIESISDIVLKIDTAGRDRTSNLEGFDPSCF